MNRLTVVQDFALRSLVFVAVMALALGMAITLTIRQIYLRQSVFTAEIAASALMAHHVNEADFGTSGLSDSSRRALDDMVATDLRGTGIVAVKLWTRDGRLLYSSTGGPEGEEFEEHPELTRALSGEVVNHVQEVARAENQVEFERSGRLLSVYAPLRFDSTDVPVGAFEVYQAYRPVVANSNRLVAFVWVIIIAGAIPAYLAQVSLVKRTAEDLLRTQGELVEMDDRLHSAFEDLEMHTLGTLQALVAAVDAKDSYTARHSLSVTDYAVAIGRRSGLDEEELVALERAGLLHDVGKIGTPESILLKPDALTAEEFRTIQEHPEMGGHIVEAIPFLSGIVPSVRWHHERWDGGGYPDGLVGEAIPLQARILAVADAFDAMTSDRPYREAMPLEAARAELLRFRGVQFDPWSVDALLEALDAGDISVLTQGDRRATA